MMLEKSTLIQLKLTMEDIKYSNIEYLLKKGWWISVSPVNSGGEWKFTCGIYKKYEKSGNWVTDNCKTFATPPQCYEWAINYLEKKL